MITKNFDFIKGTKLEKYYSKVSELELKMSNDDFAFALESGKILEQILKEILDYTSSSVKTIWVLIDNLKNLYQGKYNENIPTKPANALHFLKNTRNGEGHSSGEYDIDRTPLSSKIQILLSLKVVLHFLLREFFFVNVIPEKFDESIYYEKMGIINNKLIEEDEYEYWNNNIDIQKINMKEFILNENNYFLIPEYQRTYTWDEDACNEFVEQIEVKQGINESVYFGSIAVSMDEQINKESEHNMIKIIDGQQRITTSLILFRAIFDSLRTKMSMESKIENVIPLELRNIFWVIDKNNKIDNTVALEKIANFVPNKNHDLAMSIVMKTYENPIEKEKELKKHWSENPVKNYEAILSFLDKMSFEDIIDLYECFGNEYVVSCIKFDPYKSNEMEIFENLNSKGMELDSYDMIRNCIFNMVDPSLFRKKSKEIVNEFNIYFNFTETNISKDKVKQKTHFENFFFSLLTYKAAISNKNISIIKNKKSMLKNFQAFYNHKSLNLEGYTKIITEIGKYFHIYKTIEFDIYQSKINEFNFVSEEIENTSHKDFYILHFFLVDQLSQGWNYIDKKITFKDIKIYKKSLFEIEKWVIFLLQVNGTGQSLKGSVLTKMIKYLQRQELYDDNFCDKVDVYIKKWLYNKEEDFGRGEKEDSLRISGKNQMPNKIDIIDSLKTKKVQDNYIKNVLLKRLETFELNKNNKGQQIIIRKTKSTIEHIMPKELTEQWRSMLKDKNIQQDVFEENHSSHLDRLGNLLLLSGNNNSELGNKEFGIKVKNYNENNIILAKTKFESDEGTVSILDLKKWSFDSINDRSSGMAKIIVENIYEI